MGSQELETNPISGHFLFRVYQSCNKLEARKPVLLDALGLTDADLRNPFCRVDEHPIMRLCRATESELNSNDVFSEIGRNMVPTCFSDVGYAALFENTFEKALIASLNAQGLGCGNLLYHIERSDKGDRLIWDSLAIASPDLIHVIFATIFHIGQVLITSGRRSVRAAYFVHEKPAGFSGYFDSSRFGTTIPCFFNQPQTCLEYYPDCMDVPSPRGNPLLVRMARRRKNNFQYKETDENLLSKPIYNYLVRLLDKSGLSLDDAAKAFGMAERTLRRRLVAEGTSYRQILEQARRDTCELYFLEGTRSLSEISTKLGYSELSAFTRAYSSWYGHPPSKGITAITALAA